MKPKINLKECFKIQQLLFLSRGETPILKSLLNSKFVVIKRNQIIISSATKIYFKEPSKIQQLLLLSRRVWELYSTPPPYAYSGLQHKANRQQKALREYFFLSPSHWILILSTFTVVSVWPFEIFEKEDGDQMQQKALKEKILILWTKNLSPLSECLTMWDIWEGGGWWSDHYMPQSGQLSGCIKG